MKKIIWYIITLVSLLVLSSCERIEEKSNDKINFDSTKAITITKNYIDNIIDGKSAENKKYLSSSLDGNLQGVKENKNLKITGYEIFDVNQLGGEAVIRINILRSEIGYPYASMDVIEIKVVKEEDQYKISKVLSHIEREVLESNGDIRIRNKNNIESDLVMNLKSIPKFTFVSGNDSDLTKVAVDEKKLDALALSFNGSLVALANSSEGTLISLVAVKDIENVMAGDEKTNSNSASGKKEESNNKPMEKPIGKEISALDTLVNEKVDFMVFSPDDKYLAVQCSKETSKSIKIYDIKGENKEAINFNQRFNYDKYNLTIKNLDKEYLYISVTNKLNSNDLDTENNIGDYKITFKDLTVIKVK